MREGANALHLLHLVGSCEQEICEERRDQRGASQISYPLSRIATLKTYAARLLRSPAPILLIISASAVPTARTAFSALASFKPPSASKH
jgi:hypothetical protein